MSNLARAQQQQQKAEPKIQTQSGVKIRKSWLTPGEKLIGIAFAGLVCFGAIHLVTIQSDIYQTNKGIQDVQASIKEQQKVNSDLETQVKDLSSYDRLLKKAKEMGLDLHNNNVKVVPGK